MFRSLCLCKYWNEYWSKKRAWESAEKKQSLCLTQGPETLKTQLSGLRLKDPRSERSRRWVGFSLTWLNTKLPVPVFGVVPVPINWYLLISAFTSLGLNARGYERRQRIESGACVGVLRMEEIRQFIRCVMWYDLD